MVIIQMIVHNNRNEKNILITDSNCNFEPVQQNILQKILISYMESQRPAGSQNMTEDG